MLTANHYQRTLFKLTAMTAILTAVAIVDYNTQGLFSTGVNGSLLNSIVPFFFLLAFGYFGLQIVKRESTLIWTPAAMFLAYTAIFKGLGPLVHIFGNETTSGILDNRYFSLSDDELLGTQLLNLIGTLTILIGLLFTTKRLSRNTVRYMAGRFSLPVGLDLKKVAIGMILIGGVVQFFLVYPYRFGFSNSVLPGTILRIGQFFLLGTALLAYVLAQRPQRGLSILFWTLVVINIFLSFLEFYKSLIVLSVLLPALGAYAGHRNLKKLVKWIAFAILFYLLAAPLVSYGRYEIFSSTGTINQAGFAERFDIVTDYIVGESGTYYNDDFQQGWARLSYAGQQAYAMREHARGNTFDTISDIWIVFVPRIIWPNKPAGIGPGKEFYYYVAGRDTNRSSVTVYADAYWNFGWVGVVLLGLGLGIVFGKFSEHAYYWLYTNQVLYFPVLFAGIDVCMRGLNSWIINGVFGRITLVLVYFVFIFLFSRFLVSKVGVNTLPDSSSVGR